MASAAFYQAFVEIVPEAKNLRKNLAKEFDSVGPEAGRNAGKGINSGILGSFKALAGPLALAIGGLGLGKMLSDSVSNASDFAEAGTAITAVFGSADSTIQKFAANSAATLGQSTNQALDAARVFGVFGKAAGLTGEELAGFSTDFITLAADLASFNNTTPEAAIEALGAGLRGESEPLRQFGILLDDATLKARATELGIYSGTGALTQQQKVLASQAEIMAQTSLQQGDFAKTSGGLANQQRILAAGLENLSTTFGALLLPVMLTVVGFLNRSVIPALQKVSPALDGIKSILVDGDFTSAFSDAFNIQEDSKIVDFFFRIREGVLGLKSLIIDGDFTDNLRSAFHIEEDSPLVDFLLTVRESFGTLGEAFRPLIGQLLGLWQAFSPLSLIFQAVMPILPQLVTHIVGLGAAMGPILTSILSTLTPILSEIVTLFSDVLVSLLPLVPKLLELLPSIAGLLPPLISLVAQVLPPLVDLLGVAIPIAVAILIGALDFLIPILAGVISWTTGVWSMASSLFSLLSGDISITEFAKKLLTLEGPFGDVMRWVFNTLAGVKSFVSGAVAAITSFATSVGKKIGEVGKFFTGLPGKVIAAVAGFGTLLFDTGKNLVQGLLNGIKNVAGKIVDSVLGPVKDAVSGVKSFLGIKSPSRLMFGIGVNTGEGLINGLNSEIPGATAAMSSLVSIPNVAARIDSSVYGSAASFAAGAGAGTYTQYNTFEQTDPTLQARKAGREFQRLLAS